jgi:excisionase family DNA binding protein
MNTDQPGPSNSESAPISGELISWKEIAEYLGVDVRTAQRWERERGLPIQRVPGARSRVKSHTASLDAWMRLGQTRSKDLCYSWPLAPGITAEVRSLGGPVSASELDLLCEYLQLVKTAWSTRRTTS